MDSNASSYFNQKKYVLLICSLFVAANNSHFVALNDWIMAIPAAARSKMLVGGSSLAGTAGSNPAECMEICLL
jgi:hypothetical protein